MQFHLLCVVLFILLSVTRNQRKHGASVLGLAVSLGIVVSNCIHFVVMDRTACKRKYNKKGGWTG